MSKKLIDLFKTKIERKFFPNIEYLNPKEIKDIFLTSNFKEVESMTNNELLDFYSKWYKENSFLFCEKSSEIENGDLESDI